VKSKKDNRSLYFIALIPNEPLKSELTSLKNWMFKEFGIKAALRSPPHITLHMPFRWKPEKEEILFHNLGKLASFSPKFEISLCDFNCFKPRVIYVDVINNEQLQSLKKEVMSLSRKIWKIDLPKDLRGFNPHITIAFRDLKKPQFYEIWEQLKDKPFKAEFKANSLALLKHNGKSWDVYGKFELN
jgi:2'-5' RNA ligase